MAGFVSLSVRSAASAAFAAGACATLLAACGGAGSSVTVPTTSVTGQLTGSATTFALPSVGIFTGQLLAPASTIPVGSSVTLLIVAGQTPPAQLSSSHALRPAGQTSKSAQAVSPPNCGTISAYYSITPNAPVTLLAAPSLLIYVNATSSNYAAAFFPPGAQSAACTPPAATTASSALFTDPHSSETLGPAQPLIVVLYTNATAAATPSPTATPSAVPAPSATPSPVPTSNTSFTVN